MRSPLLLFAALACGPVPGGDSDAGTAGEATTAAEPTGGSEAAWQVEPGGCGGLYGVVLLAGGDLVVAGEVRQDDGNDRPLVARYTAAGDEVWTVVLDELGDDAGFVALARVGEDDVIAVGYREDAGGFSAQLRVRVAAADGAVQWIRSDEPESGALYGAAWSPAAALWTTGAGGGPMLVARYDGDGGLVASHEAVGGIGYAVALAGDDGAVVCGRADLIEGGQLWLGRYAAGGTLLWSATGPDPGVGAFSDCWDVAVGSDLAATTVEAGYPGARVARYAADGALAWEFTEPNAGAQAVGVDGATAVVAGWSASKDGAPATGLRSHGQGERHGWLRRFGPDGGPPTRTWIGVDRFSPRDLAVDLDGSVVIVGQRVPTDGCAAPWLGRVAG